MYYITYKYGTTILTIKASDIRTTVVVSQMNRKILECITADKHQLTVNIDPADLISIVPARR